MFNLRLFFRWFCFLGLLFCCSCDQRLLIDQLRWDFLEMENEVWNLSANGLLDKPQNAAELYLATKFYEFDQQLKQMPEDILYGVEPLRTLPDFLFLYSDLKSIQTTYEKFREYQTQQISGSKTIAIEDMIYDITNNKTGVKMTIDHVYELIEEQGTSIRYEIYKMFSENYWCKDTKQSPQQLYYNLYNLIGLYDLKAYVLQQFSHIGNRLWDKEDNVKLSISTRREYEKRVKNTIDALTLVGKLPRDIWRCDPKFYIEKKNYDQFTRLVQGHIQNEVDMSSKRTCRATCSEYSYTKSYGCYDHKSEFCQKTDRCYGKIIGCFFVESYASICLSGSPYKRYDYIRYDSGKVYGHNDNYCSSQKSVNSWTRWFVRCHYCMCLCDERGPWSDRYVNLRPVMADVKNNRIVTGIRLVKHNQILHLQIQEGKLLPYSFINQSTVHWVKLDDYTITDNNVFDGRDFFTLEYGKSSMAMDQIQVKDDNHVITGVRFQFIDNKIVFQIHVSPFNWHTGEIDQGQGYYIYNSEGRSKIQIKNPDIPTRTNQPSTMNHESSAYVEFTHSDFSKDAAQTTIPFIDTQEVINKPAVPLTGAGLYYKGNKGYGGFVAPMIKTYDYGPHLSNRLPPMGDRPDVSVDVELS